MNKQDIVKEMFRQDLNSFSKLAFRLLNPKQALLENWHHQVINNCLLEALRGKHNRIIINLPPRSLKSHLVSVAFPAWVLGRMPSKRFLFVHNNHSLGRDLSDGCHYLLNHPKYRSIFGPILDSANGKRLTTAKKGYRHFANVHEKITGLGADIIIVDDPISATDALDQTARNAVNEWFDLNLLQRQNNSKKGIIVVVMQRLHENDLSGYLLAKQEGWHHINIPAIATEYEQWDLGYGQTYERKKGELLQTDRMSNEDLLDTLSSIGGYSFALQYLQAKYKPRYGIEGYGVEFITPLKHGLFYDGRKDGYSSAFIKFEEKDFLLPKVFGIGSAPIHNDMRIGMSEEEAEAAYGNLFLDTATGRHFYDDAQNQVY